MNHILSQPIGNNIFSYGLRRQLGSDATLIISHSFEISALDQVKLGDFVVFEEVHNGTLYSCTGLAQTYIRYINKPNRTGPLRSSQGQCTIVITDNHNHVLPYWLDFISQYRQSLSDYPISLVHIDQHSDLGSNCYQLDLSKVYDRDYQRDFAHLYCNIGNFITPCIESGLITHMTQIRTEYKLNEITSLQSLPLGKPLIVDIDMDFLAPEMGISHIEQTMSQIRQIMEYADLITIATSPYFIDQQLTLSYLHKLLTPFVAKS